MILRFDPTKPAPVFSENASRWGEWIWQLQNTLTTADEFARVFKLLPEEEAGLKASKNLFKTAATPYYASLAAQQEGFYEAQSAIKAPPGPSAPSDITSRAAGPLRRILMPTFAETQSGEQQMLDPLGENHHSPAPRIIHRYSDRVLFLVTDNCSVYCRFCTRKRFTGQEEGFIQAREYEAALNYIKTRPGIREVILSGGDPLTLSNKLLARVLGDIREIPHIEIIRIGTRMPVVCPMRVDSELAETLKIYGPIYMMTHFSHPIEVTDEARTALTILADRGVPLFNQMVLLNGVNNHPALIQALSRRLLYLRVKPYYMFQCDPSQGTDHLRTTVESSEAIVRELWGHLSGLAMPTLSLDIPDGGGKATLVPDFMTSSRDGVREFEGWDGKVGVYRNPKVPQVTPLDAARYEDEWAQLKNAKSLEG